MEKIKEQKFDGYADVYDEWFMKNENLFSSELRLFKKALGDISWKKLLSVGCGSGLFESFIDSSGIEGIISQSQTFNNCLGRYFIFF